MAPAKLQPALIGGVAIGVLSALPLINLANCCCGWVIFGGGLAAYLMQQNHPEPITIGDGAIVGLIAGVIGAFVGGFLSAVLNLAFAGSFPDLGAMVLSNPELPPEFRRLMEELGTGTVLGLGFALLFIASIIVSAVFGLLGGIFGTLIFRKNPPSIPGAMPPPIPPANRF